jgi:hypothetical protein
MASASVLAWGLVGCSSDGSADAESKGTLAVPLATQGPSGTTYRLRDAVFEIGPEYWAYPGGEGGASSQVITVSSEDDPNADVIQVSVERGYRVVQLLPGWRLEKVVGNSATDVEATLLSPSSQWVYVRERSTSFVEFNFGLGDREIWFNGKLNLGVNVYEDPEDLYGYGGAPDGVGGAFGFIEGGATQ